MDDLESLELLSLVSKVTSELQNHLGINEKTLAEFVIAQRLECKSLDEFKDKLSGVGADFPPSLVESVDRLVRAMHPKLKRQGQNGDNHEKAGRTLEETAQVFRGLALPDKDVKYGADAPGGKETDAIDDTFAMLESLAPKARTEKPTRKRSRSPDEDRYDDRQRRKDRYRSRSRSRSRDRRKSRYEREKDSARNGDRHRGRGREEEDHDRLRRRPEPEVDDEPKLYKVYDGHVTGIKDFGAFVNLHGVRGKVDGLVHVSALVDGQRVNHPSDLLSRGQEVKVKIVKIEGTRIGLSMKDVDQETGMDLAPQARIQSGANMEALGSGRNGFAKQPDEMAVIEFTNNPPGKRQKKRMTSPERWEVRQLIASGVAKASDYPDLEEEYHSTLTGEGQMDLEVDIDIEVRDEEPPFLAGQTKLSLELSPVRIIRAPEGSMNRAAMAGTSLAKERREMKQQEAEAAKDAEKVDFTTQWQDPLANPEDRKFASDLRRPQAQREEAVPEWKRVIHNKNQSFGKRTNLSMKEQRESLPIFAFRDQLIKAVRENQVLVVVGETGSGKTTQLTQYLAEAGFTESGMIGCTQPRRVAAMSVAKRVAEEVGCKLGAEVGYWIRFEDVTSPETRIKYMTDGMLQREILVDPQLSRYSVIMLDEAHERTIATDVLFALLKKAMKRRPDLKVIATSATLDADKFSSYFNECPIFTIPGRTFPVEILYSKEPESDYLDAAITTTLEVHLTEPPGDILVFLTGQEEIDTACEVLFERMKALGSGVPELEILPIYSALPTELQSRVFEPAAPGSRKVVIATNIAETSLTIDGIVYVIDAGYVKENVYDPKLGMDALQITPISQAAARQRSGRAGRTGPGKCFRLYTEAAYQSEMLPTTVPEIQRQNLGMTVLLLKAMGINNLVNFDFMDPPAPASLLQALEELYALQALDQEGLLTRLGRKMADLPMDPALSKVLIASIDFGCSDELLSIIAMVTLPNVFYRPKDKMDQADQKRKRFFDPHGDHLMYLNVYRAWERSRYSKQWCQENFVQARSMSRAKEVRTQLEQTFARYKWPIKSCGAHTDKVRQALCSGLFRNVARKDPQEGYKTLIEGTPGMYITRFADGFHLVVVSVLLIHVDSSLPPSLQRPVRKASRMGTVSRAGLDDEGVHALHHQYRAQVVGRCSPYILQGGADGSAQQAQEGREDPAAVQQVAN